MTKERRDWSRVESWRPPHSVTYLQINTCTASVKEEVDYDTYNTSRRILWGVALTTLSPTAAPVWFAFDALAYANCVSLEPSNNFSFRTLTVMNDLFPRKCGV
ncbi:uncharacterized protein LOC134191292 [Corticium candelabrum]|uniref:uncharacterized protein LOC134191292 n=1 Tax=Corticium candelabrum TaxID=121492 RepID=UPI002E2617D0|nr:uncharacterized protein LOC134191292 [Corticium candelabrum]